MEQKEAKNLPNIQINAQYIKDLSFEGPALPGILAEMKAPPAISVDIDTSVSRNGDNLYTVELTIKANASRADDQRTIFICELTYGGLVTLNVPEAHVEPILLVEIPHFLFPYARAIVANTTREAGLPPLQINPVDFAALYRQKIEGQKAK